MSSDLVSRWIEAHNGRDMVGMLACVNEDLEFRPLRLIGGADTLYEAMTAPGSGLPS